MPLDADVMSHFNSIDWGVDSDGSPNSESYRMILDSWTEVSDSAAQQVDRHEEEGCKVVDGDVVYPAGMDELTRDISARGLTGMTAGGEYGVNASWKLLAMCCEQLATGHTALMVTQMLTDNVYEVLDTLGNEELKAKYLPKMASGEWKGAMVMTEPNAGSDLGAIITRVTPMHENDYRSCTITGTKSFISTPDAGVSIVLVRDSDTFDETKGTTKGLSMYLVPKFLADGNRNYYQIAPKLEKKMGMHASPTGTLNYEGAKGFLIGEKGQGMKQFFRLMNFGRMAVAAQAVGQAQSALNHALDYADGDGARVSGGKKISKYPAVADMLVQSRVGVEAIRSLLYAAADAMDQKKDLELKLAGDKDNETLAAQAEAAAHKAYVLVCLAKYYAPKWGERVTSDAVQVFGGYGFMYEYPVARHFTAMKILDIYEGTGQIQAAKVVGDLVKGRFEGELDKIQQDLESEGTVAAGSALDRLSDFRVDILRLRDATPEVVSLRSEPMTIALAEIYCSYLLIQQSKENNRKDLIAEIFARNTFRRDRIVQEGDLSTLTKFDEIMYHRAA